MAVQTDEPWYVEAQRARKADRLATLLRASGRTADDVAHLTETERRAIEAEVGIRRGSAATWRIATEKLAGSVRPEALCLTCGIGDPDGVPGPRKPFGHDGRCSA